MASPLTLPAELFNEITSFLSYDDARSLRLTNKLARELINPLVLRHKRTLLKADLLASEAAESASRTEAVANAARWAQYFPTASVPANKIEAHRTSRAESLNCYSCLKSLPRGRFNSTQLQGPRSLGHRECSKRFCMECGWKKGIWERGTVMGKGREVVLVCRCCGELEKGVGDQNLKRSRVCSEKCLAEMKEAEEGIVT